MEEFRLALKKDHEELRATREGQEESAEDKAMRERIQNLIGARMAEAGLEGPVQETEPIEAQQDDTSPSEHAKRTYLDTVIANAQRLADHNKPQDATLPSDNDLPAQQPDKVL
ncbi:hypothetical protein BGZ74_006435 [Mortierella antarctica]|nr:hypothetical protein BGZ74_006435 [Mortierella antarctica]